MRIDLDDFDLEDESNTCEQLTKVFAKLETLSCIKITDPNTLQCIRDSNFFDTTHYDICVEVTSDIVITCRINFLPSDYTSSPYICVCQTSDKIVCRLDKLQEARPVLEWDLKNEGCLYDWFNCFSGRLKQCLCNSSEAKDKITVATNGSQSNGLNVNGKKKASDELDIHPRSKQRKLSHKPIVIPSSPEIDSEDRKKFRKAFFLKWIRKYKDNIIQYDDKNYEYFTLYLTFAIGENASIWRAYLSRKNQKKYDRIFKSKIAKVKPLAPMLVHFTMDGERLKMKLLSVVNTANIHTTKPDCSDLQYNVDFSKDTNAILDDVRNYLHEAVIKFHLFQFIK